MESIENTIKNIEHVIVLRLCTGTSGFPSYYSNGQKYLPIDWKLSSNIKAVNVYNLFKKITFKTRLVTENATVVFHLLFDSKDISSQLIDTLAKLIKIYYSRPILVATCKHKTSLTNFDIVERSLK